MGFLIGYLVSFVFEKLNLHLATKPLAMIVWLLGYLLTTLWASSAIAKKRDISNHDQKP